MSQKIKINAVIAADVTKVWDYYTLPEHITQWNFASDTWHCPSASNDLRVGGKYSVRMEAKDGSFGFDLEVTYDKIELHKHLSYTMINGRHVSIDMISNEHSTEINLEFDAEELNPIEMQRDGWQAILNNFKAYTESHA